MALMSHPCAYCGSKARHIDHVRPLCRGGTDNPTNLVPCCPTCNSEKGALLLFEWRADRIAHAIRLWPCVAAEYDRQIAEVQKSLAAIADARRSGLIAVLGSDLDAISTVALEVLKGVAR